jgi:hypothetical protein
MSPILTMGLYDEDGYGDEYLEYGEGKGGYSSVYAPSRSTGTNGYGSSRYEEQSYAVQSYDGLSGPSTGYETGAGSEEYDKWYSVGSMLSGGYSSSYSALNTGSYSDRYAKGGSRYEAGPVSFIDLNEDESEYGLKELAEQYLERASPVYAC